jgi:hypothetical protein
LISNEIIVSRDELLQLFDDDLIIDTKNGWLFDDMIVQIVALHEQDPRFIHDVSNANLYKLILLRDLKKEKNLKNRIE